MGQAVRSIRFRQAVRTVHHSTNHTCRATLVHLNRAGRLVGPALYGLQPLCTPPLLCTSRRCCTGRRHGSNGETTQPGMCDFSDDGQNYTFSKIPAAAAATGIARSSQLSIASAREGSMVRQSSHYGPSFIVQITPAGPISNGQADVLDQFSSVFGSVVRTINHSTKHICRPPSSSLARQDAVSGQSSMHYGLCAVSCM
jgi:hypothetical protein